ncbi:MAG: TauD/TfdA family dioxygenase [Actinomycetia bacterium]|nr:TauD/TfdA family dioxygenase [Actinomycetes bacterium]
MGTTESPAWTAADVADGDWVIGLDPTHQNELVAAVAATASVPIDQLSLDQVELPTLSPELRRAHRHVVNGRGFVLLRDVPVHRLDREGSIRAYVICGLHLGTPVSQNAKGHLVGHVKDLGNDPLDPVTRIYTTTFRQRFHTDSCDIVALLCLQTAKEGGRSAICSSTAVVAELERTRPDLVSVLEQPFVYDRKGEVPVGEGPWYEMPVVHRHDGFVTVIYARDFIDAAAERFPDVATLSPVQLEALDAFDELCSDPRFRIEMDLRPGDVQFIHNHQVLHARSEYVDHDDVDEKRHLVRLWLSAHDARPLPAIFERRYGPIRPGRVRGGIRVPGGRLTTPLEAE